jgi:hypothetical protein
MRIDDITEETLLANKEIKSVFVAPQWCFSYDDMNSTFMGAFQNIKTIRMDDVEYISFSDIFLRVYTLKPLSDFERAIKTALNHNIDG